MEITALLEKLRAQATLELPRILAFWSSKMRDGKNGGFYGQIDGWDILHKDAEKGGVLNARILWTYSASYNQTKDALYLTQATYAWSYIQKYFVDKEHGGIFWSVSAEGQPFRTRKQIYCQAFMIYALSEYYIATEDCEALALATQLFTLVEKYSFDPERGGYFEAFTRDWQMETDLRLSEKDENEKKTMNTHLHVIESYAALYRVWKNKKLKKQIVHLLNVFHRHIYDANSRHLILFFDEKWHSRHAIVSYGHDIEAGWLLQEAAEVIEDTYWIDVTRKIAIELTDAASEALDMDGGLWYEKEGDGWVFQKHWWPQAEAVVGFLNAFQISMNPTYLERAAHTWDFVEDKIKDSKNGEWFWGINQDGTVMREGDKAGFWKCPYHNCRACLEIMKRVPIVQNINA
ncbi:MAG: AGE family epimerase/isomerase [Chitinophagaceae bacterium]